MGTTQRIFSMAPLLAGCFVAAVNPVAAGDATSPSGRRDAAFAAAAAARNADQTTDRMIVKLRDSATSDVDLKAKMLNLGNRAGVPLSHFRAMSGGGDMHVARLAQRLNKAQARALARILSLDPSVAYVEPDFLVHPQITPNDTHYIRYQWDLFEAAGGINMPAAWDITIGSSGIYVAVIDTGITNHAEFANRLVGGYDFIGDTTISNDGNGRDSDGSDPGDYCRGGRSSWHGTHVAGTISAAGNNGMGIAGINWGSKILSVRVLGACGGYTSDVADGMRWAAGYPVPGVPNNLFPARVENLSLGGAGPCSTTFQNAVTDVVARGTVVVVAAGNDNIDAANFEPANCNGVIAVAATTQTGAKANFSNYGSRVAIAAPGSGIMSTVNTGGTTPVGDGYAQYSGTSMAAPHVAGVVSLMLSQNSAMTPAQVLQRLQSTARAFPPGTGNDCTTALCGAGIVNAAAALVQNSSAPAWIEDATPTGALLNGDREGWNWVQSNPAPFSGNSAHQSLALAGLHQHFFYNANALSVNADDTLFTYAYLDPANMPTEVMLQWNDGNWEHRAYWGANRIAWGADGTAARRYMGPLPAGGQWVRLEVPASMVGLAGRQVNGMAFTLFDGRVTWDLADKAASSNSSSEVVWIDDALPSGASAGVLNESWNWVSDNPAPFSGSLAHQSAVFTGLHQHYFSNASPLTLKVGEKLFSYVYLDPANPPTEVMLQWHDGAGWEHRAYWGANQIAWGADATAARRYIGPLPAAGQWVRLEVAASNVGLESLTIRGMAFTLFNGHATWDRAGKR